MFCPKCAYLSNATVNYCGACGYLLKNSCTNCGSIVVNSREFNFCYECGVQIQRANKSKKSGFQQQLQEKYGDKLALIKEYIDSHSSWVSYQNIAQHLNLTSCYIKLNPEDERSTVGYLIHLNKFRDQGYYVRCFMVNYEFKNNITKAFNMRFIKHNDLELPEITEAKIIDNIKGAYPAVDFNNAKLIGITQK